MHIFINSTLPRHLRSADRRLQYTTCIPAILENPHFLMLFATRILSAQHQHTAHRRRGSRSCQAQRYRSHLGQRPHNNAAGPIPAGLSGRRVPAGVHLLPRYNDRLGAVRQSDEGAEPVRRSPNEKRSHLFGTVPEVAGHCAEESDKQWR